MSVRGSRAAWTALLLTITTGAGLLTATPATALAGTDAGYAFTVKLDIGDEAHARACTGALVDAQWVLTAASCFADNPQQPTAIAAGAPALKTTATLGRADLSTSAGSVRSVIELVPRTDRDVVLAKLAQPVGDIIPALLATSAPSPGERLTAAGFGRTKSEWVPNKLHSGVFTVGSMDATSVGLNGSDSAVICQGDTGGPTLRAKNGTLEVAAVNSRSWQGGCLDTNAAETRTGALSARTDDIAGWVRSTVFLSQGVTPVTAADLDGDKVTDLFAKNSADELFVLPGKKGGGFGAPRSLTGGWNFPQTAGGDFTADNIADLIAVNGSGELFLFVGEPDGTFRKGMKITDGWTFTQTVAGDFDGDGKADLIAKDGANDLYRWKGNGNGTFDRPVKVTGGWGFRQTVAADFTGDRIADLIAVNASIELFEWSGQPGGGFTRPTKLTDGWNFTQTTAGDFNGDGKADLIAKNTTGTLYLWSGNGNATFNAPVKLVGER